MRFLKLLDEKFEASICIVLISVMTLLIFIQVIMRYFVGSSLAWSEELARYLFIWLIYLGIPYAARKMKHVKIEATLSLFPKSIRHHIVTVGDILFLVFCLVITVTSYSLVMKQMASGQYSPAMHLPMWIVYLAPCVGFALTSFRQVQVIIYRIKTPKEEQING